MIRNILIGVLIIGVAGTAFWGYQEHREKNAVLLNAENNYQRAFHDLTYQMDLLHDKIGTTLAMNSRTSLSPALAEVWKLTAQAQSNVGQLPLTLLPFNKTEEFLSKIGDFSYKTAVRDLDKEPLTDEEYNTLQDLYKKSSEIEGELRKVQYAVLNNNLRWMDVELALAKNKEPNDNTIIDGFKTVEKTVESYGDTELGVENVSVEQKDQNFKNIKGKSITKNEAVKLAKKYSGIQNEKEVKVTESGKGSDFGFYSVSLKDKKTNEEANLDITKKGGYPIWYLHSRNVKEGKISLNEANNKAKEFLEQNNFVDLKPFESVQYDNIGVFSFVSSIDNVRIYPETITVKVALDNGEIIGFAASDYLHGNKNRKIPSPTLTLEDAKSKINPNVEIMEDGLAIITNELNEEVLCYEFLGVLEEDTYRIFINAENGMEEKIEKLQRAEPIYEKIT